MPDIVACSVCSRSLTGANVLYNAQGAVICAQCNVQGEIKASSSKAAGNLRNAALSCFGLSLVALLFNPYFLLTAGAVSTGIYALRTLLKQDQFTAQLRGERGVLIGVACLGLLIAAIPPVIILIAFIANRV